LITILLFFAIPTAIQSDNFSSGILLYTILITSVIMALALIAKGKHIEPVDAMHDYWIEIDRQIEKIPEKDKHKTPDQKEQERQIAPDSDADYSSPVPKESRPPEEIL
jgi:hypothetical protein